MTKARQAASGLTGAKLPAGFLPLQHPRNVQFPPTGDDWRHEIELDGYRMQLRVKGPGASWYSRNGNDWTARLPDFAASAVALGEGTFDGELCALKADGSPDFSALRSYMGSRQTGRIMGELTFIVFDLLADASGDLRGKSLQDRREHLEALVSYEPTRIRLAGALPGHDGRALLDAACGLGLEGIVSKRLSSLYEGGERRPETWVKAKCRPSQEVVIGGWEMNGAKFRSLLVGVWEGELLQYVGTVGTGFGAAVVADLMPRLRAVETDKSPFTAGEPPRSSSSIHWTSPNLVAAADIAEWTGAGKLRQASFKGLREDKLAREVVRERPA